MWVSVRRDSPCSCGSRTRAADAPPSAARNHTAFSDAPSENTPLSLSHTRWSCCLGSREEEHVEHSLQFPAGLDGKSWLTCRPTSCHHHLDMFSIPWTTCSKYSCCISVEYARLSSRPSWRKMCTRNFGTCNPSSSSSVSAWNGLTISYLNLHAQDLFQVCSE